MNKHFKYIKGLKYFLELLNHKRIKYWAKYYQTFIFYCIWKVTYALKKKKNPRKTSINSVM